MATAFFLNAEAGGGPAGFGGLGFEVALEVVLLVEVGPELTAGGATLAGLPTAATTVCAGLNTGTVACVLLAS